MLVLIYVFLSGIFIISPIFSQVKFNGEFRTDLLISGINTTDNRTDLLIQNNTSLIMNLGYSHENWRLFSDLRINLWYGYGEHTLINPTGFLFVTNQQGKHLTALEVDLNRLYIKAYAGTSIFTIGRSYANFGQNVFFNTLEWSKSFSLFDPSALKPALNLLSWDIGIGSYGKFSVMVAGDDEWQDILVASSLIVGIPNLEWGLVYQYKGLNHNVLGTYFKADIVVSLFGSYAAHIDNVIRDNFQSDHEASLGLDYSFSIGLSRMILQQIFYIHALGAMTSSELLAKELGDFYFKGFAYSYSSVMLQVDEFISLGIDVLANILDGSGLVLPKGTFVLLDSLTLDMMLGVNFGKNGTEFGHNPRQPALAFQTRLTAKF